MSVYKGNSLLADINLSEYSFLQYTNCITKIPQDIKLELNNGVLTLRAGSKVYYPNGFESDNITRKFDTAVISTDMSFSESNAGTYMLTVQENRQAFDFILLSNTFSGITPPTSIYSFYYDTTNNLMKLFANDSVNPARYESLPIAIFTVSNNMISSIDQIFNGFGYIGSSIFVLPGVEGLIADGRNEDGTLKSKTLKIGRPDVNELSEDSLNFYNHTNRFYFGRWDINPSQYRGEFDNPPEIKGYWGTYYNTKENYLYYNNAGEAWIKIDNIIGGEIEYKNEKITKFSPYIPRKGVSYNEIQFIAKQAIPSNKYIELTVGQSGTSYTAPAMGWVYFQAQATSPGSSWAHVYTKLYGNSLDMSRTDGVFRGFIPVQQSEQFYVLYGSCANLSLRFVYAQGAA